MPTRKCSSQTHENAYRERERESKRTDAVPHFHPFFLTTLLPHTKKSECNKLLASNVFMWFTWLVQIIPLIIFPGPAIAKATESDEGTVLRSALGTRS